MSAMIINFNGPLGNAREARNAIRRIMRKIKALEFSEREARERDRHSLTMAYARLALNGHEPKEPTPCEP